MKSLHRVLTVVAVVGVGVCLSLGFGVPRAKAQEGDRLELERAASMLDHAAQLAHTRRDDPIPPFEIEVRTDVDADIGRITYVLLGLAPADSGGVLRAFEAPEDEVLDIHTLILRGGGAFGHFAVYYDYEPGGFDWVTNYKTFVEYEIGGRAHAIHFDPPIRFRNGDAIVTGIFPPEPSFAGTSTFVVHGTIVPTSGGDTLRVE